MPRYIDADNKPRPETKVLNHHKGFQTVKLYERAFRNGYSAWNGFIYKPVWKVHMPWGPVISLGSAKKWKRILKFLKEHKEILKRATKADTKEEAKELLREEWEIYPEELVRIKSSIFNYIVGANSPRHELADEPTE